jgi:protein-disulfide isomerase
MGGRGTPTFFVNGRLMVGAQPFDVFQAVIEEELGKSKSKKK